MPPSTPRFKSIMDNIKSTLEALTSGTDYFYTWADVRLSEGYPLDIARDSSTFPVAQVAAMEGQVSERLLAGSNAYVLMQREVDVECVYHDGSSRAEGRGVLHSEQLVHDVVKALCGSPTRGGYATNTRLLAVGTFLEDYQKYDASAVVRFQIEYRHPENDPSG